MRIITIIICLMLMTTTYAQWVETRRAFVGTPEERMIEVPYYYPYVDGDRDLDFTWSFYWDYARLPAEYRSLDYQRLCFQHMRQHGLNSVTVYGWHGSKDTQDITDQLVLAKEEGLADRPVMILPCGDPREVIANLKVPAGIDVVGYGPDEPAATPEAAEAVAQSVAQWHEAKMRVATAISADSAKAIGDPLDIWIVHVPKLGEITPDGKHELWMYDCQQRGTNFALHRYEAGLYAYAAHRRIGVKALFWWAYVNDANSGVFLNEDGSIKWNGLRVCEHALPGPGGPLNTVGMDGIREGVVDFGILHEVERRGGNDGWLDQITGDVPLNFWDGTDMPKGPESSKYWWDAPDVARPNFDLDSIRKEACRRIHLPSPD